MPREDQSNPPAVALTDRPQSKTQLFVSDLAWSVDEKMLRTAFEAHGDLTDCFVAYNGRSSRGFGYVTYKEGASAAVAVKAMHGQRLGISSVAGPGEKATGEGGEAC